MEQTSNISVKNVKKFIRIAKALDKLMREIRASECPSAEYYVDGTWGLNLMCGPSHTGSRGIEHREHVVSPIRLNIFSLGRMK